MPSPVLTPYSNLGMEPDIILEPGDASATLDMGPYKSWALVRMMVPASFPLQTAMVTPFEAFLQALEITEKREAPLAQGSSAEDPLCVQEEGVVLASASPNAGADVVIPQLNST